MPEPAYKSPYSDQTDIIPDGCVLYRRVPPVFVDWGTIDDKGEPKITSGAFQDYGDKQLAALDYPAPAMSVERGDMLVDQNVDPHELVAAYGPTYGVAKITAALARENQQGVQADPIPESQAHAIVFSKVGRKRSGAAKDALALGAKWEIVPTPLP